MSIGNRIWMSAHARKRLEEELAELLSHHNVGTGETGDRSDQVIDAWMARKIRIRQIYELLSAAPAASPPDDGLAEPGMVLTIRYDDTGETETFLLGARGAEDTDIEVYSVNSPLGAALAGAMPGQQRSYRLPSGAVQPVTLLSAKPFGAHLADAVADPAVSV